jgi:protein transport protein SEC23
LATFFTICCRCGSGVVVWRNTGYHEQNEYESLNVLIESPKEEAQNMIQKRFSTPQIIVCEQSSFLALFLLARCNFSKVTNDELTSRADNLSGDELSYTKFIGKLREASVKE